MRSLLLLPLLTAAHGASLLTLSNPVADGAIVTTAGNNDRSDWTTTTAFPTDADESYATDFQSITIAHDSARFYIREQFYRTSNSGFFAGNQILLFDTDQSSGSGYTGPGGTYSIGAEYLLEGTNLYAFTGGTSQSAFLWDYLGSVSYDDFPYNDHELSFSRSLIGSPETFDFIAVSDYFGGADLYPDSANGGDSGGYYTYTVVPEPTTGLLGLIAALGLMRRRREP